MKCVLVVFVICLIVQLQTCRVNAKSLEEIKAESEVGVPVLNLRISDDDRSKMVNNLTDLTSTVSLNDSVKEESVSKEQLSTDGDLSTANNTNLDEGDSTSELKRIKKSNSLTTICVEIKPSSPYEPPYFMCRGTEPQNHPSYSSGGGYKPSSYGGSNSYKPDLNKGDGYGNEVDYRPNNDYGYGKPNHPPGGYGTHDEYISPGQNSYIKPKPVVPMRGEYVKPASLVHHQGVGGSGVYGKPNVYDSNPTYNNYGGAGEGYSKPEKYQMAYDSYGPSQTSYGGKPIKYGGSSYNRPEYGMPTYDAQGPPTYEKPAGYYGTPGKQQYGGGIPGATYGPSYNQKPTSSGYGRPPPGKYQPSYTGKKGSGGYQPQGGYRTIDEDDEVEAEEMEMQKENSMGPELQSSYNPGLPVNYGAPPPSPYVPKYPPMYPPSAAKPYTYQPPTPPQLPCGSNILVGCHPNVVPVPCYGSPSYNLPQPPVIFSAAPPQGPSIIYGPPAAQQPVFYYPNLATPRQMASPDDGTFRNQGQEPKKEMSDNQNTPTNSQGNDMSTQNVPEMKTEVNVNNAQQDNDDKMPKISDNAEKNSDNGQATKSEEEKTRLDTDSAAADGPSQDVELLKKSDNDEVQRTKIDSIMRMQQMQQMGQMMAGNGAGIQMRRDTKSRTREDGHNLKRW